MVNSIKKLKKYCKANLNVFKKVDVTKNFIYMIDFLCQIEITAKHIKIV